MIVDDNPQNIELLQAFLESLPVKIVTAVDGVDALEKVQQHNPDLILLDIMMPGMDGIEVTRRLKGDPATRPIPVLLLTAKADVHDVVDGLNAGADDYVTKPFDHSTLTARVRSLLRTKALYDTVERQAAELAILNRDLEARVTRQVAELERTRSLQRFLAPQVADFLLKQGDEASILDHHRREIVVLFCDLRGFTSFAESAEPEEVMDLLGRYHATLGPLIHQAEGTLERFTGDGMMVFFNDPLPCDNPAERAVRLALAMHDAVAGLATDWRRKGRQFGFGVGIAQGYATIGKIGFDGRLDYSAIGSVTNLASRLCDVADPWEILVTERVLTAAGPHAVAEDAGTRELKGFSRSVRTYQVRGVDQSRAES